MAELKKKIKLNHLTSRRFPTELVVNISLGKEILDSVHKTLWFFPVEVQELTIIIVVYEVLFSQKASPIDSQAKTRYKY